MRASIRRTCQAEEDLLEIWAYIADDNVAAADNLLDEFDKTCAALGRTSLAGRDREELAPNIRSFPVGSYVIFYRHDEQGVTIIRVLHGARDMPELL